MLSLNEVHEGDCLELMPLIPDNSIDLILTDPPYFKVKGEAWDRQWNDAKAFLAWLDTVLEQVYRVLKPNGSLYLFASPKMAARVEVLIAERFNIVNSIIWAKSLATYEPGDGRRAALELAKGNSLRGFLPFSERVIFAEHYGADNIAKGEAGYAAKCDELRGFLFEPLRGYLDGERQKAGKHYRDIAEVLDVTPTMVGQHYFSSSQWHLPTLKAYEGMQRACSPYMARSYEELRQEYEELRQEYEELRRPFSVCPAVPYTDVWTYPTVKPYAGKHPCEKPQQMLKDIINASSKPDATVLDAFAGTASTALACIETGRNFICIEKESEYVKLGRNRIKAELEQPRLLEVVNG